MSPAREVPVRRLRCSAALAVSVFLASGWLLGASPALAADPTIPPLTQGHHVVDAGWYISSAGLARIEEFASRIEAAGGGRIGIYTAAEMASTPSISNLSAEWGIDGLLMMSRGDFGDIQIGATLKSKLTSEQHKVVDQYNAVDAPNPEAWILTMLARVDAFLGGTRVFDGAGVLDASGKEQAEKAARDLGDSIGAPVYVDIAFSGDESPSTTAFFNGADLASNLRSALVVAIGVSDTKIGGYLSTDNDKLWDAYNEKSPWQGSTIEDVAFTNGDRQATVLSAITGVEKAPLIPPEAIFWIGFTIVIVVVSVAGPFLFGPWLIRKMTGLPGPIKNARVGDAVIESIGETGVTVTMPSVGPEAPEYKFGLQVTPDDGGVPYHADTKALVPRIFVPMMIPGQHVGVQIDPANPQKVALDFAQIGGHAGAGALARAGGAGGSMAFAFGQSGQPLAGQIGSMVGAVRSGDLPTIKGSADQLLATGTHGTAVVTSAQPLGKRVRDVNPNAPADRLADPVWLFTVKVKLPGQAEFPAAFGHRVPAAKAADIGPGTKLAVAVDEADKNREVAIDWDRSPLP
jgi:hypothetical protein